MITVFQDKDYYRFIESTGFLEPFCFSVNRGEEEVGVVQGYIQKDGGSLISFLSRRAIINGGPWLSEDITDGELETLLKKCVSGLKSKTIYIETRNYADYSLYRSVFEKVGFRYEPHYNFVVDTSSVEVVDSNMGKSRKRDVNASLKNGAMVVDDPSEDDVAQFYSVLENLYRTKVKTPLFPLDFFLQLHKEPFCKFILVRFQDEIIGGTVLICDAETVYEWFACGKDGVYKNVFPSTVATYFGIRYSAESGHKAFDMMGAGAPGDGGYGVREFKAKFGGELVEYGRYVYVCNDLLFQIGRLGVKLIKRI